MCGPLTKFLYKKIFLYFFINFCIIISARSAVTIQQKLNSGTNFKTFKNGKNVKNITLPNKKRIIEIIFKTNFNLKIISLK